MKLLGRVLLVSALLSTVTAFISSGGAGATTKTVTYPVFKCELSISGNVFPAFLVPDTLNMDVGITAADSVAAGSAAAYTVKVGGSPGPQNAGFKAFNNGRAKAFLVVNGDEQHPVETPVVSVPDTPVNTKIPIPDIMGSLPSLSGATTVSVARVDYYTLDPGTSAVVAQSRCFFAAGNRATVTIGVQAPPTSSSTSSSAPSIPGPTSSTTSSTTTTTTTAKPTTTTTDSTTTTAKPTTTTTAPPETGGSATLKSVQVNLDYTCDIDYASGFHLPGQKNPLQITLWAPDKATTGSSYGIYMDVAPGINNGPFEIPIGKVTELTSEVLVAAPGTPASLVQENSTNTQGIGAFAPVAVPRQSGQVTAAGKAGDSITLTPGKIVVGTAPMPDVIPAVSAGTVVCSPPSDAAARISTALTDQQLTQAESTPPPAAPAPAQTPAAPPATEAQTNTTTTAPAAITPQSGGAAGVQAQVISKTAAVTYECKIYSGSNLITTQQDTQNVTIKTVDKVAPGGTLSFQMTFAPGPKTGPVPLPQGVQNIQAAVKVGGAGSPPTVQMNDGAVTTPVATNSNVAIPTSSGSVKVTGNPGEQITLTPGDMSFETARPPSKTTCTATNAAVLTTTEIAAGVSVQSATAARLAVTGNSRGWLVPLALAQLALGLGLVLLHRRRRQPVHG